MAESVFMKLGMHVMAPEPISKTYFVSPSRLSMYLWCIPLSLLGSDSAKRYRGNEYTLNNRRIVGRVIFYAVRIVSRKVGDYNSSQNFFLAYFPYFEK
jgi:hypothetical protein